MKIRDISLWESFYWAAKTENFTKAAVKLGIGAPLLSKRVSRLEEELGTSLFQRTTRKVKLTEEGRTLLPQIERSLEDFKGLEERFSRKEEISGTIVVSCVTAFTHRILAPLLIEFTNKHRKVKFDIIPSDDILDIIDHQIDVAIRVQDPTKSGADFVFKKLVENKLILVASPKYLKSLKREIKKPEDLKTLCSVMMLDVYKDCKFTRCGQKVSKFLENQKIICDSGMFLTEMARLGTGVALRSVWDVQKFIDSGELVQVLPNHPIESFGTIYSVIPTRRLLSARVRAFIDFLSERINRTN